MDADVARLRANRQDEIDSAVQYRAMAEAETDESIAKIYRELADVEDKHACIWERQLADRGVDPGPRTPSWRARTLRWLAKKFGPRIILATVHSQESAGHDRSHASIVRSMMRRSEPSNGPTLARVEGRHRNVGVNALRAAVLGANDGLCSNLALVMGVAGASQSGLASSYAILIAGLAGLLAGAFSMALGEWISMTSARELAERELRIEREELEANPEDERVELQLIYEAKGVPSDEARQLSHSLLADSATALDVLAREELGLDPAELGGSPWTAAYTSFVLFAIGAIIPVIPFALTSGTVAFVASIAASGLALFGLGAAITLFTGRSVVRSGGRQLVLGLAAAAVTFGVGRLLGVAIS